MEAPVAMVRLKVIPPAEEVSVAIRFPVRRRPCGGLAETVFRLFGVSLRLAFATRRETWFSFVDIVEDGINLTESLF